MRPVTELWTPVLINGGIFKENYIVSNLGRVKQKRRYKNGDYRYVLVNIINSARPVVKMIGGNKQYRKSVAKLVLSSFYWREGCECANITYLDGNPKNCMLSNLRYKVDMRTYNNTVSKTFDEQKSADRQRGQDAQIRSCATCKNNPCFSGMENLSSDFGALGCNGYKPKEEDNG